MARDRRFSIEKLNRLVSNKGAMPTRKRIGIAPATAFDCTRFGQDVPYQLVKKNGKLIDVLLSATAERGVSVVAEQERTLSFPRFLYQLNLPSIRGLKPLICRSISPYQLNPTSIGPILRNQV